MQNWRLLVFGLLALQIRGLHSEQLVDGSQECCERQDLQKTSHGYRLLKPDPELRLSQLNRQARERHDYFRVRSDSNRLFKDERISQPLIDTKNVRTQVIQRSSRANLENRVRVLKRNAEGEARYGMELFARSRNVRTTRNSGEERRDRERSFERVNRDTDKRQTSETNQERYSRAREDVAPISQDRRSGERQRGNERVRVARNVEQSRFPDRNIALERARNGVRTARKSNTETIRQKQTDLRLNPHNTIKKDVRNLNERSEPIRTLSLVAERDELVRTSQSIRRDVRSSNNVQRDSRDAFYRRISNERDLTRRDAGERQTFEMSRNAGIEGFQRRVLYRSDSRQRNAQINRDFDTRDTRNDNRQGDSNNRDDRRNAIHRNERESRQDDRVFNNNARDMRVTIPQAERDTRTDNRRDSNSVNRKGRRDVVYKNERESRQDDREFINNARSMRVTIRQAERDTRTDNRRDSNSMNREGRRDVVYRNERESRQDDREFINNARDMRVTIRQAERDTRTDNRRDSNSMNREGRRNVVYRNERESRQDDREFINNARDMRVTIHQAERDTRTENRRDSNSMNREGRRNVVYRNERESRQDDREFNNNARNIRVTNRETERDTRTDNRRDSNSMNREGRRSAVYRNERESRQDERKFNNNPRDMQITNRQAERDTRKEQQRDSNSVNGGERKNVVYRNERESRQGNQELKYNARDMETKRQVDVERQINQRIRTEYKQNVDIKKAGVNENLIGNWQAILYTVQAIYLCHALAQMVGNKKSAGESWWGVMTKPAIKVD